MGWSIMDEPRAGPLLAINFLSSPPPPTPYPITTTQRALAEPERTAHLCRLRAGAEERRLAYYHHHHDQNASSLAPVTAVGELDPDDGGDDGGCCGPSLGAVVLPSGEKQQEQEEEQVEWGLVAAVAAGVVSAGGGQVGGPLLSDDMFGELMELMCPPWDPMRVRREGSGGNSHSGRARSLLPPAVVMVGGFGGKVWALSSSV